MQSNIANFRTHHIHSMKKIFVILIVSLLLLPLAGQAKAYKIEDVPMVHLKDSTKFVCNPDKILSPSTQESIDTMLLALKRTTGIEVVVMALTDIEDGDCYQFALSLGEKYGVGKKKKDNGLIVLLSTGQRCIQIVTGYGLEGILPDAVCKRIQEKHMNPYFAKGEWDKGMLEGMKAIRQRLANADETDADRAKTESSTSSVLGFFAIYFFGLVGFIWFLVWICNRPKRCPKCNERAFKRISMKLVFRKGGKQCYHVVYTCKKCGHTEERDEESSYSTSSGGGRRSSGGGSRSSGGSFGGGHFGGGGAGSKF